ncbi:MAG: hypothetical protein RIQ60_1910 [Pseudomonadota bacterium]|jgi:hypothetical protein
MSCALQVHHFAGVTGVTGVTSPALHRRNARAQAVTPAANPGVTRCDAPTAQGHGGRESACGAPVSHRVTPQLRAGVTGREGRFPRETGPRHTRHTRHTAKGLDLCASVLRELCGAGRPRVAEHAEHLAGVSQVSQAVETRPGLGATRFACARAWPAGWWGVVGNATARVFRGLESPKVRNVRTWRAGFPRKARTHGATRARIWMGLPSFGGIYAARRHARASEAACCPGLPRCNGLDALRAA